MADSLPINPLSASLQIDVTGEPTFQRAILRFFPLSRTIRLVEVSNLIERQ